MKPTADSFYDPIDGTTFGPEEKEDAHGTWLIGIDDDDSGLWWGTERAFWVLPRGNGRRELYVAHGTFRDGSDFTGYFYGTAARVVAFVTRYHLRDLSLEVVDSKDLDFDTNLGA